MNKREIKRVVLGQLATYLRTEVIVDGGSPEDLARTEEAQRELAEDRDGVATACCTVVRGTTTKATGK
ncbi:hypothetical protein G3N57_02740 [Paraburkholderia sp. Se-20369]|nr:hypothetical protein [Paraburkholderia sp. Se-20369]